MLEIRRGSGVMLQIRRVEMPADAPVHVRAEEVELEDEFPRELYDEIQRCRPALLDAIHHAVIRHLDRCTLFERDAFPCRECLTGDYYLGPGESYGYGPDGRPQVTVKARCLGWADPWNRVDLGRHMDYLGIDVYAEFDHEAGTFEGKAFSLQVI